MKKLLAFLFPETIQSIKRESFQDGVMYYKNHCVHTTLEECTCDGCRVKRRESRRFYNKQDIETIDVIGTLHNLAVIKGVRWFEVGGDDLPQNNRFHVLFANTSECCAFMSILNSYGYVSYISNPVKGAASCCIIFNTFSKRYLTDVVNSVAAQTADFNNSEKLRVEKAIATIKFPNIVGSVYVN